jgi:hypothetical protein
MNGLTSTFKANLAIDYLAITPLGESNGILIPKILADRKVKLLEAVWEASRKVFRLPKSYQEDRHAKAAEYCHGNTFRTFALPSLCSRRNS